MSTYDKVDIDYKSINLLRINNVVHFQGRVWKIYDIENGILYLKNPQKENIGVSINEVFPILINEEIMKLCGFTIISHESEPMYYIGENNIQTKIEYQLINETYAIDMKLKVVMNYVLNKEEQFSLDFIDKIDENDTSLKWLHQVQNIFFDLYKFELVDFE